MARQNPVVSKTAGPLPNLDATIAFPSGSAPQEMEMPNVNMTPNDGTNPNIPDAPFANGKDQRNRTGGSSSNPNAGMAGA